MAARDLKKESFWRRIIRGQAGSGLCVRAWCRKRRVKEVAFYWWRRELARRDAEQPVSFVPVHVREDAPAAEGSDIEIVLNGGWCLRIRGRVDRQMLADVMAVLGPQAC
jgi:transposase